jgi:hypothetical protein
MASDDLVIALLEAESIIAISPLPGIRPGGLRLRTATLRARARGDKP